MPPMNLDVNFSNKIIIDEDESTVRIKKKGNYIMYYHKIYATGKGLDQIKSIKYVLHSSFLNPVRISENVEDNFGIYFWAWGEFPIHIIIKTKNSHYFDSTFEFKFSNQIVKLKQQRDADKLIFVKI